MYICTYTYTNIYIHKHLHTHTFTYTYVNKYLYIYKTCIYTCMCVYVCVFFFCCVVPCHVVCALFVVGWVVGWYVVVVVVVGPWSFQLRMMSFLQRTNDWASSWTVHGINSSIIRWTFFQSLSLSSRREGSRETNNIIWLTNWKRNARSEISKESMTDSYEITNSVLEWLKIIETKNFVGDGMLLRVKITLTIWQHKNTSTTRANGGFIQISKVLILCHWGIDLISSRHCLPCRDCNKKQKKNHMCLLILTSTKQREAQSSSSTWWNWQGSWWSSCNSESQEGGEPSLEWTWWPVTYSILARTFENGFHEFNLFVTDVL